MTNEEQVAIDHWFERVQNGQPPGTLALLFYCRDGKVYVGRKDSLVEMERFDLANLPQVTELARRALESINAKP